MRNHPCLVKLEQEKIFEDLLKGGKGKGKNLQLEICCKCSK
jgi:hypothetical protein